MGFGPALTNESCRLRPIVESREGPVVISTTLCEYSSESSVIPNGFLSKLDFAATIGEADESRIGVVIVIGLDGQITELRSQPMKSSVGVAGCGEGEFGVSEAEFEDSGDGEATKLLEADADAR
jgi:hypothetical protein